MSPTLATLWFGSSGPAVFDRALPGEPGIDPSALTGAMRKLLDVAIPEIISRAWKTLAELRPYADPKQHPPDEVSVVPLAKHKIRTEHHPGIKVWVGDALVHTITFDVHAELEIEGGRVVVSDGKIRAIHLGQVIGRGKIESGGAVLVERESRAIELPGTIEFDEGIAIG